MTDISDLLAPKKTTVATPQRAPVRAVVTSPPATLDAPTMRVVVPGHSSDYATDCRWVRQGDVLPAAGVDCLVVYDETGAGTVVAWEGAGASLVASAAALRRSFNVTAVSTVALGVIDGENITGVRLTVDGATSGTGGNTFLSLKPNGLSSISTNAVGHEVDTGGASHAPQGSNLYGGAAATSAGIAIIGTGWATAANYVTAHGVLFTNSARQRRWSGLFTAQDTVTDADHITSGRILSVWHDTSTVVSSLTLSIAAGTFTGRVTLETIP